MTLILYALTTATKPGVPLHPLHCSLKLLLDEFTQQQLPVCTITFALIPPYVIPAARLLLLRYPDVLVRHIQSKIPPLPPKQVDHAPRGQQLDEDVSNKEHKGSTIPDISNSLDHQRGVVNPFDMRNLKWVWNGLTFGKGPSTRSNTPHPTTTPFISDESTAPSKPGTSEVPEVKIDNVGRPKRATNVEVEIDAESLREAISSENAHSPAIRPSSALSSSPHSPTAVQAVDVATTTELDDDDEEEVEVVLQDELDASPLTLEESPQAGENTGGEMSDTDTAGIPAEVPNTKHESASRPDLPTILTASIYLADTVAQVETRRKKVLYATVCKTSLVHYACLMISRSRVSP